MQKNIGQDDMNITPEVLESAKALIDYIKAELRLQKLDPSLLLDSGLMLELGIYDPDLIKATHFILTQPTDAVIS